MTAEQAFLALLEKPLDFNLNSEILPLQSANGRFLCGDFKGKFPSPSFANAAMDGFAALMCDCGKKVQVIKTILAGENVDFSLKSGECAKIMTGAKMPKNADCVVPYEKIKEGFNAEFITLPESLRRGECVRAVGEDVARGAVLLKNGAEIDCGAIGLLASQGVPFVRVFAPLRIGIFSSGDELREPWEDALEHEIYNANAPAICALLRSFGFENSYCGIIKDDKNSLKAALESDFSVIITSGGASKGAADFMREILNEFSAELLVERVEIRPGSPLMVAKVRNFGSLDSMKAKSDLDSIKAALESENAAASGFNADSIESKSSADELNSKNSKFIIALPGYPLSAQVVLRLFVVPFLRRLAGARAFWPLGVFAEVASEFSKKPRVEALLGAINENGFIAHNGAKYGSGSLLAPALCNALALCGAEFSGARKGELLKILPFKANFGEQKSEIWNL